MILKENDSQRVPKDLKAVGRCDFIPVQVGDEQALVNPLRKLDLVLVSGHRLSFQGAWPPEELATLLVPLVQTP